MRIRHELRYDATPDQVYAMLGDAAFREQVCEAMAAVSHEVSITGDAATMSVRVVTVQATEGSPQIAKKLIGDRTEVARSETWDSPRGAALVVELPGKPVRLTGTISLTRQGTGTVEVVEGDLRVGIPLVGGKLEKLIARLLDQVITTEQAVGRSWLPVES